MVNIGSLNSGFYRIWGGLQSILPLAKAIGGPIVEKVINIVTAATEAATTVKEAIDDGKIIASSHDVEELNDLLTQLQAENDELMKLVDAS